MQLTRTAGKLQKRSAATTNKQPTIARTTWMTIQAQPVLCLPLKRCSNTLFANMSTFRLLKVTEIGNICSVSIRRWSELCITCAIVRRMLFDALSHSSWQWLWNVWHQGEPDRAVPCKPCHKKEKAKSKHFDRRRTSNQAGIDPTAPGAHVNHALLSPQSALLRLQKTVRKSRSLEKKVKRLELVENREYPPHTRRQHGCPWGVGLGVYKM